MYSQPMLQSEYHSILPNFAHVLLLTAFDKFNHSMLFPIYKKIINNHKPTFGPKLAR